MYERNTNNIIIRLHDFIAEFRIFARKFAYEYNPVSLNETNIIKVIWNEVIHLILCLVWIQFLIFLRVKLELLTYAKQVRSGKKKICYPDERGTKFSSYNLIARCMRSREDANWIIKLVQGWFYYKLRRTGEDFNFHVYIVPQKFDLLLIITIIWYSPFFRGTFVKQRDLKISSSAAELNIAFFFNYWNCNFLLV